MAITLQEAVPDPPPPDLARHSDVAVDVDAGLHRLTRALAGCIGLDPERPADTLLARLGVSEGAPDDIALVAVQL